MEQVPSINGGWSLVPLPSPSLTAPAEMQSRSLFLCPAVFPQAESTVSGGQTDRQRGVWERGGWQCTCRSVDAPEIKEQHGRVREIEGHLEGKGSVRAWDDGSDEPTTPKG